MEKDFYEINCDTLLLLPINDTNTRVYETNNEFIVKNNCFDIINNSCLYFGSSYNGRAEASKDLIGSAIKAPIIVEESRNIIFFPTASARILKCCWISYNNLIKYDKIDNQSTRMIFNGNIVIDINVKYNIIDNQYVRSIKLDNMWKKRKK